ncbi:hypothetical protein AMJ86_03830 [bacterium SM23_57]|jgi:hypothetical protein|nr:MAG: hypothetical protein AMJ86_03830 [bacterium SM23_57]
MPKTQINCPQCRQPIIADVQQLFDLGENPQDKQIFLSGGFNIAMCPHCGFQGRLSMPLVYHDPSKELLLTYFPPEIGVPLEEQQKSIGPIITRIVDRLPQEKRKGYLFNPATMFTLQVMLEKILEADGITKEMIRAQEERLNLIQRLLDASEDVRKEMIEQEDEQIDDEFFGIFSRLLEGSIVGNDDSVSKQFNDLQQALFIHSSRGRELRSEAEEVQTALQSLQELGEEITREKLLDLVVKAPNDTRLRALVRFARPGMDYTFFQMLSNRIERARSKGRARLSEIREKLLDYTKEVDDEIANRTAIARQNVESILQADDIKGILEQNMDILDEFFIQAVRQDLEEARKSGNLEHSSRLQEVVDAINELSTPPAEIALIGELLEVSTDEVSLNSEVESHSEEITPEFLQMLSVLITRTQVNVDNSEGEDKAEQQEIVNQLQAVYNAALRYSMRRSLETG